MKISKEWLDSFVKTDLTTDEISAKLTLAGLEIDAIEKVASDFTNIVVGEILEIKPHPDADKLQICTVDIKSEKLQIVCGAKNIYTGMKAPVAKIGATIPMPENEILTIKKGKLRGVESFGMMCSEQEMGLLDTAKGLMDLPENAPVGDNIRDYLNLDDVVLDIDLTPNRSDCLSVYGVARELVSLCNGVLTDLYYNDIKSDTNEKYPAIIINDVKKSCLSYSTIILNNISNDKKTPLWIVEKLRRSGIKTISMAVDVINFVMIEIGQPMHVFDKDKINGTINIRYAKENEFINVLGDKSIDLRTDTLVIADNEKVLAIAGIIGSIDSSVTKDTKNIIIESAHFTPNTIAGKARSYGLHTESSHRFERGVDYSLSKNAIKRAVEIILNCTTAEVGEISTTSIENDIYNIKPITIKLKKINSILGFEFDESKIGNIFRSLGMEVKSITPDSWTVFPPSYRFDINIPEDLIEELARVYGFDKLPMKLPILPMKNSKVSEKHVNILDVKKTLVSRGYNEVINYSFIDPNLVDITKSKSSITIKNPISKEMSVMRDTLITGLLQNFKYNINRQQGSVRIFESGKCFSGTLETRVETDYISGLIFGQIDNLSHFTNEKADFYSLKGDLEAILSMTKEKFEFIVCDDSPILHPGQSAYIINKNKVVGIIGVIHPNIMSEMGIKSSAPIVFELKSELFYNKIMTKFENISKFPEISRDISFTINKNIPANVIIESIMLINKSLIESVHIFDVYQGDNLEVDMRSLAVRCIFKNKTRTLTDEIVDEIMEQIFNKIIIEYKADIRGK